MLRVNMVIRLFFTMFLLVPILALADEIVLKSGQKVEGKIIKQTDKYIKIDTGIGIAVTYYADQINTVNGSSLLAGAVQTGSVQSLLDFKLGTNNVGENKVEFTFPPAMAETLCMDCEKINKWEDFSNQNIKLVVNLYDHNRQLTSSSNSACAANRDGFFGPILFADINKDKVKDIAYFSVSTENCPELSYAKLSDNKPQEAFARKVIDAIKQGKDSFLALYSSQPTSDAKMQEQEQMLVMFQNFLNKGGQVTGITPMKVQDGEKYKNICTEPFNLNIGTIDKTIHNDGIDEGSFELGIPIGKVNGVWKILYSE